jgi:hypothetical protein
MWALRRTPVQSGFPDLSSVSAIASGVRCSPWSCAIEKQRNSRAFPRNHQDAKSVRADSPPTRSRSRVPLVEKRLVHLRREVSSALSIAASWGIRGNRINSCLSTNTFLSLPRCCANNGGENTRSLCPSLVFPHSLLPLSSYSTAVELNDLVSHNTILGVVGAGWCKEISCAKVLFNRVRGTISSTKPC